MPRCVILALPGGPLTSVVGPLEVLTLGARLAGAGDWRFEVVSDDSADQHPGLAPVALAGMGRLADVDNTDALIISAMGDPRRQHTNSPESLPAERTLLSLKRLALQGSLLVSICSGAYALARAGLLDQRQGTCHWAMADWMAQQFPACHWQKDAMLTRDGNVWCAGGASAWQDMSLTLVQHWFGAAVARQCARLLLLDTDRGDQRRYMGFLPERSHQDHVIHRVQDWLDEHACEPFTLAELAGQVALSERQFKRRFSAAVGMPPRSYVQSLRIEQAKLALEQSLRQVDVIARECGYEDVRFFRSLFRRATGLTPLAYRARFARKRH
ncbi:GlxA family transcriptional regulator [Thalassolituus sp. LLYu03]|uniref:GlxA family transcriptional regulator n=1 Tax=Thalassolituus sp. LLYu03 TaxID=3421656 RepID=UPI003D265D05